MLKTLEKSEFLALIEKNIRVKNYFLVHNRWKYYKYVIRCIKKHEWESCLELGPYVCPLVSHSDVMDYKDHGLNPKYLHDAKDIPWPISDKQYDLFIALQVWEHLETYQSRCFAEVMRISKNAILSFTYK